MAEPMPLDLYADEVRANPYPLLEELREAAPVHWVSQQGLESWIVTRYDEVRFVLGDPRFIKAPETVPEALRRFKAAFGSQEESEVRSLLATDPPDHTRLRRLVGKAFTPRRVDGLRRRAQQVTDGLLDAIDGDGGDRTGVVDLVEGLTIPLPVTMIGELVGVPAEDRADFKKWSDALLVVPRDEEGRRSRQAGAEALRAYFADLVAERRRTMRPELAPDAQPDLVSALLTARDEGGRLSEQELLSMLMVVLTAGHETTGNLIGNSVLALFDWPDRRRRLQADPGLLRVAVEELLRFVGPVMQPTLRVASEDVEIGGVVIPAGSVVVCMLASANRDPRRFPAPDEFDVAREDNPHLGFGHGIHFCLGAPLARMEAETALGSLLRRFPDMELAAGRQKIPWRPSALLRGPAVLPVRLRPAG
ncbi:MAG TPA: cytochrome P450 [Acidimicrobiia bacterium]|nr:cytochrome P450 [Acidimicrobiia bacterium]HMC79845.1 cytochrome P450 [Acidimicrobiia bacterium]